MKVSEITSTVTNNIDTKELRPVSAKVKNVQKDESAKKDNTVINPWQKNILLQAIDLLENSMQTDNSHPLSRADYRPIDSFQEAMVEVKFLKNPSFKSEASQAQANINAKDIAYLFS